MSSVRIAGSLKPIVHSQVVTSASCLVIQRAFDVLMKWTHPSSHTRHRRGKMGSGNRHTHS